MSKKQKALDTGARLATGVAAGAVATWTMKKVMSFIDKKAGISSHEETPKGKLKPSEEILLDKTTDTFGVDLSSDKRQKADQALKWALGAGGGLLTAWVRKKTGSGKSLGRGLLLGLGSFILFEEILKPSIGARKKPTELPLSIHARDFAGHATYGLVNSSVRKAASKFLPV